MFNLVHNFYEYEVGTHCAIQQMLKRSAPAFTSSPRTEVSAPCRIYGVGWDGMGWDGRGEGGFKQEVTCVYLWLIYVDVWQKPSQYCNAIIFQLKINKCKLKKKKRSFNSLSQQGTENSRLPLLLNLNTESLQACTCIHRSPVMGRLS